MRGAWSRSLLVLALAVQGALPALAVTTAQGATTPPKQRTVRRGTKSPLEKRVATLTRALDLDARQQAAVRRVLQDQRDQVQRIWRDQSGLPADRIVAMRRASTQTADRIRALLNEEQRKKYDPPAPADPGKTIQGANVEEWMNGGKRL